MCCLFGLVDCRRTLTAKQKSHMISALATAAEARGTDATGIAYNSGGKLRIYKRPWPGRFMRFRIPEDAAVIMGHTRMATQGSARMSWNNHPFSGTAGGNSFALAHNGVLYNDKALRRDLALPGTKIETDSYIAVQLLEREDALDFSSLRFMAEQVAGSFVFTVLDRNDTLYIVRGDNPLCLYYFPKQKLYLYASTEDILQQALRRSRLPLGEHNRVPVDCGRILKITCTGGLARGAFDDSNLLAGLSWPRYPAQPAAGSYLDALKSVAAAFGYRPEDMDALAAQGFSPEELEEFLYCGEL